MFDIQRVGSIIADIEKYIKELDSYKIKRESDLDDGKTFYASSMLIFGILGRVINLGGEILSAEKEGAPNTYQDIMPALVKANVIDKERSEKIGKVISKRNIFAHFYGEIKKKDILETLKDIPLIESFLATVKKRIR